MLAHITTGFAHGTQWLSAGVLVDAPGVEVQAWVSAGMATADHLPALPDNETNPAAAPVNTAPAAMQTVATAKRRSKAAVAPIA